jgi:hypothetical protein
MRSSEGMGNHGSIAVADAAKAAKQGLSLHANPQA